MSAAREIKPAAAKGLHGKLVSVRERIGSVEKSKTNQHLRYQYRTEDDYYNAVRPLLDDVRVMLYVGTRPPIVEGGYVFVTMDYTYVDSETGETFTVSAAGMGDLKDGTGVKKAQTGAARYHFQKQYLIADGEDDEHDVGAPAPRAAGSEYVARTVSDLITPKQLVAVRAIANATGVDAEKRSVELFGVRPEELSRAAGSTLIDDIKAARTAKPRPAETEPARAATSQGNDEAITTHDAARAGLEQRLVALALNAEIDLKGALLSKGKKDVGDLDDEELQAWVKRMEAKAKAKARLSDKERETLKQAFADQNVDGPAWLIAHGVGSGKVEHCSVELYNLAMKELFS